MQPMRVFNLIKELQRIQDRMGEDDLLVEMLPSALNPTPVGFGVAVPVGFVGSGMNVHNEAVVIIYAAPRA